MVRSLSIEEADPELAAEALRVSRTGEPLLLEREGEVEAALVSRADFELLNDPAVTPLSEDATDEEIVAAVKRTRRRLMRELYGDG